MTDPVVLLNPFTLAVDRIGEFRSRFDEVMALLREKPGFRGGGLHAAIHPDRAEFAFINYNRWESEALFNDALRAANPERVFGPLNQHLRAHGSLYRLDPDHTYPSATAALVSAYFDAAHRDEAALLQLLTPDAVIDVPTSLPYGGVHRGANGFRCALADFAKAWTDVSTTDLRLVSQDDTVVALSRMTARARLTGAPLDTRVAETFRVHAGRIREVRPHYADTAAMVAALGHPHSGAPQL